MDVGIRVVVLETGPGDLSSLNLVNSRVDLMVFPEYSLGKIDVSRVRALGRELSSLAKVVVLGSGVLGNRNVSPIIVDGELVAISEKLNPSRSTGERLRVAPGGSLAVVDVRGLAAVGVVVCVDVFYPEVVRSLALSGASIVVNPSKIPVDRVRLWRATGMVRAFENSVWLIGVNGAGSSYRDGRRVEGGSFAAGPNGEFVELKHGVIAELDLAAVEYARSRRGFLLDVVHGEIRVTRVYV